MYSFGTMLQCGITGAFPKTIHALNESSDKDFHLDVSTNFWKTNHD